MQEIIEIPIEEQKQITLNRAGKTIIYLGIPTNILCIEDRLEPKQMTIMNDASINDFTATLYLGKITFKKKKINMVILPRIIFHHKSQNLASMG